jgi:hypothetical protein
MVALIGAVHPCWGHGLGDKPPVGCQPAVVLSESSAMVVSLGADSPC